MVLPVLGLLGLAGGALAAPHLGNYAKRTRGRYNSRVTEGVDASDPGALGGALFGGGLLSGAEYLGDARDAFEGGANRANALERARIATGPSYARLEFDRQRDELARAAETAAATRRRQEAEWNAANYGTPQEQNLIANPFLTPETAAAVNTSVTNRATQTRAEIDAEATRVVEDQEIRLWAADQGWGEDQTEAALRIPGQREEVLTRIQAAAMPQAQPLIFGDMTADQKATVFNDTQALGGAVGVLSDAASYMDSADFLSKSWGSGSKAQLQARIDATVLPALAKMQGTGVLNEGDYERYEKLLNISAVVKADQAKARIRGVLQELDSAYQKSAGMVEHTFTPQQIETMGWQRRPPVPKSGQSDPPAGTVSGRASGG